MTQVTIDDRLLSLLGHGQQQAELCDSAGRRVGYFIPEELYASLVCRWANAQVSDEELQKSRLEPKSFSTSEVLDRLKSL